MLLNKYLNRASNVFALNRVLLVVTIVMGVSIILLIQTVNRQIEARETVLVPLTATGSMQVGYDTASDDYLRAIARYIVNLGFTFTADTARSQFEELLTLFAPEQRESERRRWLAAAEKIEKVKRVSRTFFIDDIRRKGDANRLIVKGRTVRRLGKTLQTERVVLAIDYRIRYGRFMVVSMNRLDQTDDGKTRRVTEEKLKAVLDQVSVEKGETEGATNDQ